MEEEAGVKQIDGLYGRRSKEDQSLCGGGPCAWDSTQLYHFEVAKEGLKQTR